MEKATIGAILRNRIKEKGYRQEDFAEKVGIGFSTLKKYMQGESCYTYELLLLFAEELECSVEYLLGQSKSPIREHHEIAEQTRLSEEAIQKLTNYAQCYDKDFESKRFIKCLDLMICEENTLENIFNFLYASKPMCQLMQQWFDLSRMLAHGNAEIIKKLGRGMNLEEQQLVQVVSSLKDFKARVTPELIAELKALNYLPETNPFDPMFEFIYSLMGNQEEQTGNPFVPLS